MDKILFKKVTYEYDNSFIQEAIDIYINGQSLIDIIRDIEITVNKESPHFFAPVSAVYLYDELTKYYKEHPDKIATVLGCRCGEPQCDPLNVSIDERKEYVRWNICDVSAEKEFYVYLESFTFDKKQYEEELNKLKNWIDELIRKK